MQEQEGFVLLSLPNCSISALGRKVSGQLELDCVTVNQSVVLVLRLENLEYPIDPTNPIYPQQASNPGSKSYVFTNASDGQILLTVSPPNNANELEFYAEDVQTFEGVLTQYADFRASEDAPSPTLNDTKRPVPPPPTTRNSVSSNSHAPPPSHPNQVRSPPQSSKSMPTPPAHPSQAAIPEANASPIYSSELNDYKGQLVLVNEEDGHVVGQFDDKLHISADPTILQRGHEKDPVIIEVNEDEGEGNARECFIRAIPPEQHDWMTKGASIVSYAITTGANLLATTITAASSYYIKHSQPSPHHTGLSPQLNRAVAGPSTASSLNGKDDKPNQPPRFVSMITSQQTRRNLHRIHTASGKAVKVSNKTMAVVDDIVKKVAGRPPKKKEQTLQVPQAQRAPSPGPQFSSSNTSSPSMPSSPQITRSPSPQPPGSFYSPYKGQLPQSPPMPPPYPEKSQSPQAPFSGSPYIPYQNSSRQPSPLPPSNPQIPSNTPPPLPQRGKLSFPKRLLLSADVILSTIDESGKKLLDVGGRELSGVMNHKYGKEAADSTTMMTESVRNAALVYVDMKGVGRRALIKRVGKEYIHGKIKKDH